MQHILTVLLFTSVCTSTAFAKNACHLEPVDVSSTTEKHGTDELKRGDYLIRLRDADKMGTARRPIWTGGIEVVKAGQPICQSPVGIIENPIAFAGKQHLLVSTYSGSDQTIYMVNLDNCSIAWKSPFFQSASTRLSKDALQWGRKKIRIRDNCLPDLKSAPIGREDEPVMTPASE